ncbi:MAG: hypothetical protein IJA10_09385 [Lachnospiraceae bacterium]|nr:hypothetical protein [Lachnospiraceae bacterium]
MYYVPEGTKKCGYYQCERCGVKFLSLQTMNTIDCTYCAEEIDMEMGPDEDMTEFKDTAKLIEVLEGEDVEKMDTLLSLAITGGNYDWI